MKIATKLFNHLLETKEDSVLGVVIENGRLFRDFVEALYECVERDEDSIVFSNNGKEIDASEKLELISEFVPFSLNSKSLAAALSKKLEKLATQGEFRDRLITLINEIARFVKDLSLEIPHEIEGVDVTAGSLIKASNLKFSEEDTSLANKLIDYMRLVRDFVGDKAFVLINVRAYFTDGELSEIVNICLLEKIEVVFVDGISREVLPGESRFLVDSDLCEIASWDDNMI